VATAFAGALPEVMLPQTTAPQTKELEGQQKQQSTSTI
jgi:hypothetical protein